MTVLLDRLTAPRLGVDLDAIAHNVRSFVSLTPVMAVVKADGFGHGAERVARAALANGAVSLGVATIEEALALRRAGIEAPVLAWLTGPGSDVEGAVRAGIEVAVPSIPHLVAVAAAARRTHSIARVHLHVDTGMARDGAPREHWRALATAAHRAQLRGEVVVVGLMSHLARASEPGHPETAAARERFLDAHDVVRAAGLRPGVLHLAATAAALGAPDTRFDLCRVGVGLYGIGEGLRQAMTLEAPVVLVRDVAAGTPVGYGHAGVTDRATRLALVPLGYGDGVPRLASGRGEVLLHGRRRRLIGTICMDQLVVDVGNLAVEPGDRVTLFGPGDRGEPTLADWAAWSQTIPHEIMTGMGGRLPRDYTGAGAR